MKMMIHGLGIELTPSIKSHVEDKIGSLSHMLDPRHDQLAEVRVEVGKSTKHHHKGNVFYAEANMKMGRELFRATCTHEDLHAAVNRVRDELEGQIRKHKTKEHELPIKTIRRRESKND